LKKLGFVSPKTGKYNSPGSSFFNERSCKKHWRIFAPSA
jgi:hypothetical protein